MDTGSESVPNSQVLHALAKFADHTTGMNARPSIETLAAWAGVSRSTVKRSVVQLEVDGWIEGVHKHRHPTTWRICIERLATSPTRAKVITDDEI